MLTVDGQIQLTRTTRFAINDPSFGDPSDQLRADPNGFAGKPAMRGLGRHYAVEVTAVGTPDPVTGYLIDIKEIDRAVRAAIVPRIAHACHAEPTRQPMTLLADLVRALADAMPVRLASLTWFLTPWYAVTMHAHDTTTAVMRQRFDFAAAHRLHVASMSEEDNRKAFGKCNNPSGHGHNYQVEPEVLVPINDGPPAFTLHDLERLVEATIIERFDHTNLNVDPPDFTASGVNPSVEHIARVCYDLLAKAIEGERSGARLARVTVWETDRTRCTYPA